MSHDGGPAFPVPDVSGVREGSPGLSLRDYFAAAALANPYCASENSPDRAAEWAYQLADAMLAARERKP